MKALSVKVIVHVSDVDAAAKFYNEVLGFTFEFKFGDYAGVCYDEVSVHLNGPTNEGLKKPPGSGHFWLYCDEVDEYYTLIRSKGAAVTVPIGDRSYGIRDFSINDPDGNTIVFGKVMD